MNPNYPTNAKSLLTYTGNDLRKFAFLAHVEEKETDIFISIKPDYSIAVSSQNLSSEILHQTGVNLPSRHKINNKTYKLEDNVFILGVSSLLELFHENMRSMPLLQRDQNAPSNPGKWTCPGGLCARHPINCIQEELAQELGLLEYEESKKIIKVLVPVFEEFILDQKKCEEIINLKNWQEKYIRKNLPIELQNVILKYEILPLKALKMPKHIKNVHLKMPDSINFEKTSFMACFDHTIQGLTLSARFEGKLDKEKKYLLVDPEPFGRNSEFVSHDKLLKINCTNSLEFAKKNKICFSL